VFDNLHTKAWQTSFFGQCVVPKVRNQIIITAECRWFMWIGLLHLISLKTMSLHLMASQAQCPPTIKHTVTNDQ
jgi:hypothetical protein